MWMDQQSLLPAFQFLTFSFTDFEVVVTLMVATCTLHSAKASLPWGRELDAGQLQHAGPGGKTGVQKREARVSMSRQPASEKA